MATEESKQPPFHWRREGEYTTVDGEAFAKKVAEESLKVYGPYSGYWYALRYTEDGYELWRTVGVFNWDTIQISLYSTADPAAGANPASITIPAGETWLIYGIYCGLTTAANAADRYFEVGIKPTGTIVTRKCEHSTAVTASMTACYNYQAGGMPEITAPGSGATTNYMKGFGDPIEMTAGAIISFIIQNKVAGDNATAVSIEYKKTVAI